MMELSKEYLAMKAKAAQEKPPTMAPFRALHKQVLVRTLKSVTIEAEFGELKGGRTYQVGRGKGSNFKAAAAAAIRDLLKQKGLKAQRFTTCKATISFGTITEG